MTKRGKFPFYFVILLVVAGLSIAGCGGNTCGPLGGSSTSVQPGPIAKANGNGSHPALFSPAQATTTCGTGTGTGNCSSTQTPTNVAYALDPTGNVLEYAIDTSGNLTLMCSTVASATVAGGELAVSNSNFLYVLDKSSTPQIFSFLIAHASSGALTPTTQKSLSFTDATIDDFSHIIAEPSGRFVYVTNLDGNNIHVFSITAGTGVLTEVVGSPFTVSTQPFSPSFLASTPDGNLVFVTDPVNGDIFIFSVAASGTLTQTGSSPFAIQTGDADFPGFDVVTVNNLGTFLYTADNDSVAGFLIDTSIGSLSQLVGSPVNTGSVEPELVVLDESGAFLYAPDFTTNGIIAFGIDSTTGAIGPGQVAGSPFNFNPATTFFDVVANTTGEELFLVTPALTGEVVSTAPITISTGALTPPTTASTLVADSNIVIANVQ
jgi:6-phosphogluconolactonase